MTVQSVFFYPLGKQALARIVIAVGILLRKTRNQIERKKMKPLRIYSIRDDRVEVSTVDTPGGKYICFMVSSNSWNVVFMVGVKQAERLTTWLAEATKEVISGDTNKGR